MSRLTAIIARPGLRSDRHWRQGPSASLRNIALARAAMDLPDHRLQRAW